MTSHDITALGFWGKGGGIPSWNFYFPTLHSGWGEIVSWRIKAALVMESCTMYTRLGLALQGYHSPFKGHTFSAKKTSKSTWRQSENPLLLPSDCLLASDRLRDSSRSLRFWKKAYNDSGKPSDIFNNKNFWTTRWWLLKLPIPPSICSILSLEIW